MLLAPTSKTLDSPPTDKPPLSAVSVLQHRDVTCNDEIDCTIKLTVAADDGLTSHQPECTDVAKPTNSREKILFLDGLRGLAAIFAVCQHMGYLAGHSIGGVGVHMFFVLSAFLLTMLFERKCIELLHQNASRKRWMYALVDYAVRRVLRIYPLLLVVAVYLAWCSDQHKRQWYFFDYASYRYNFLKVLVFAEGHDFFVFWTLRREVAYYLCIPVFVAVSVGLRRWWWVPMLPLTGWVIYSGLYVRVAMETSFVSHLPEFVAGSIGAVVFNRLSTWITTTGFTFTWYHRLVLRIVEAAMLLVVVSVVFDALLFDPQWITAYPFHHHDSHHFVCVYITVLVVIEMLLPGPLAKLLEWSLLCHAGKVSFSMYLLHPRVIYSDLVLARRRNFYTELFLAWGLVFFWSTVSYHVVEVPAQRMTRYISHKIRVLDAHERATQIALVPMQDK